MFLRKCFDWFEWNAQEYGGQFWNIRNAKWNCETPCFIVLENFSTDLNEMHKSVGANFEILEMRNKIVKLFVLL